MEQIDATTTEPETAPGVNASCGEGPNRSLLTDFRKLRFEPTLQATPRIPIPSSQPSIHHSNSMLHNFIEKIGPGVFSKVWLPAATDDSDSYSFQCTVYSHITILIIITAHLHITI